MKINHKQKRIIIVVLVSVFFIAMIISMQFVGLSKTSVEGRSEFDVHLTYYSGEYFYDTVSLMTEQDIKDYSIFYIVDNFFVISYFLLMVILTYPLLNKKNKKFAFIIPAVPAIFDFIENISIDLLIRAYPTEVGYAKFMGVVTCLKWYSGVLWLAILAGLFVAWLVRKKRKSQQSI
jgi:hypothetical protein